MASSFRAFLVNDLFGDPVLYVALPWERRAFLFDLGDVSRLSAGRLLKITDVFVSHAHLDHFVGFDHLLRVLLGRQKGLRLYGPPDFIDHVAGKLRGYTWNLVADYSLAIEVHEVHPDHVAKARFVCPEGFVRRDDPVTYPFNGVILEEPHFRVRAVHLDHRIPCLAFTLEETIHLNVDKARVEAMGLPVGPWLMDLKRAIRAQAPDDHSIRVTWSDQGKRFERVLPLDTLRREIVRASPGQKLAYVTDAQYSAENAEKIIQLVSGADLFFCEAAYPERDHERAEARFHLTAGQAGRLAAKAGARHLAVFHFSPKYRDCPGELLDEAGMAFGGRAAPRMAPSIPQLTI
ncbi:MAG TPA: MBL fold metallo-hydrolase [Candidatus Methylomirabilis sp.]|nr:MBL fold metallo-hydrolase [Candidatus Methylomirabilis sp.]